MTKEEILKHYGIYPGFRSTYTYDGILSAMGDYAALIAAKPLVSGSLPLDQIKELLDKLTDDERLSLFYKYCSECGCKDPRCQCWNDD